MNDFYNTKIVHKPILFFDNDKNNFKEIIQDSQLPIECIHVEEEPISAIYLYDNLPKTNKYAIWIKNNINMNYFKSENTKLPPSKALDDDNINYILNWAHITNGMYKERYVLFDWDRTLSMWEGFYTFEKDTIPFRRMFHNGKNEFILRPAFAQDMITFLLDDENNRLKKIRELIGFLLDQNIEVIIITNNSSLLNIYNYFSLNNLNIWIPLLQQLDERLNETNLVYGGIFGKYEAIQQRIPNIKNISISKIVIGGKKRKSKNKKSRRKTLRKTKRK